MEKKHLQREKPAEIMINKMYSGEYLYTSSNIGYEIINLFMDDDGKYYIYAMSDGHYDNERKVEAVLLVRKLDEIPVFEVLGKATGLKPIYTHDHNEERQKKLAQNVRYGGVTLQEIFRDAAKQDTYVTFQADFVEKSCGNVYIVFNVPGRKDFVLPENARKVEINGVKISSRSQKQYITSGGANPDNYKNLNELINDTKMWSSDSITPIDVDDIHEEKVASSNLFEICGIEDYELAFSNALAYYITKYPELLVEFAAESNISIELNDDGKLEVIREKKKNIDLLIKCKNYVIVVENKIRSGINGVDKREEKNFSQLDKYYNYVNDEKNEEFSGKTKLFYILKPNYSHINKDKYPEGDKYSYIDYSKIKEFLDSKMKEPPYKDDFRFQEFYLAIAKHSQPIYEDLYGLIKQKFMRVIRERRNDKK